VQLCGVAVTDSPEDPGAMIRRMIDERRSLSEDQWQALVATCERFDKAGIPAKGDIELIANAIHNSFRCNGWEFRFVNSIVRLSRSGRFRPSEKQKAKFLNLVRTHVASWRCSGWRG
jgi:hypothetical protein